MIVTAKNKQSYNTMTNYFKTEFKFSVYCKYGCVTFHVYISTLSLNIEQFKCDQIYS